MSEPDDGAAARARADALRDEVERLREENEALRRGGARKRPNAAKPSPPAAAQAATTFSPRLPSVGLRVWQIVGGFVFLAVPGAFVIASGRAVPDFPWGPVGMLGILVGAHLLTSSLHGVVYPHAPILWKGPSGEYEEVQRSRAARRVYLALSLATYLVGIAALLLAPPPLH